MTLVTGTDIESSWWLPAGTRTVWMLAAWALMSLAGSAPTGRMFPWRSTSPATAMSPGMGFPVRMDTRAARMAAPADGSPS